MDIVLLTSAAQPTTDVLPALELLPHRVTVLPCEASRLVGDLGGDAVLLDARRGASSVTTFTSILTSLAGDTPVIAVLTKVGLVALSSAWAVADVVLDTAGPAELDARLRLAVARHDNAADDSGPAVIRVGDLAIDERTYSARVRSKTLDLTYTEFQLLKFLAQHPGKVFTRARLLQEIWGGNYRGTSRAVDTHVRYLRAKLGPDRGALIGTVRSVGYRLIPPTTPQQSSPG
jgi:DNA-binding response OmpR family regulator